MSKIKEVSTLVETKFISLYDIKYLNKCNEEKSWTVASRKKKEVLEEMYLEGKKDKIDAVIICAYHKEKNKLVIIKEFRVPINKYIYELPAGLVDSSDDDFSSAVIRELKEETGYSAENLKLIHKYYTTPGFSNQMVFIYLAKNLIPGERNLEEDEFLEVYEIDIKEGVSFVALIPEFKLSTEKARSILPKEISLKDGIYNVGRTALLVSAFANGNYNLLKYAMKDKFHQAYRSSLIEGYDKVIKESMELGALGCFLSGAGPTLMSIVDKNDLSFVNEISKFIKENNFNWDIKELMIDKNGAKILKGE